MATTWVVAASQTGARFMEHRPGFGKHLLDVRQLWNPDGRKRNHEIDSDRGGETAPGRSNGRRTMAKEHSAHDHVVEGFVHQVAVEISKARAQGAFEALILVAEPKLLGALRSALDAPTARTLTASVNKDLAPETTGEIARHIGDVLPH